jgi:uncharacterized phage infection (PIP) family protein YhgE
MDSIDITSPEFNLANINSVNEVISGISGSSDYTNYIYIGAVILLFIVSFFVYKFYYNKEKKVSFQENLNNCDDGVCMR